MGEAKKRKAEIAQIIERAKQQRSELVKEFEAIGFKWKFEGTKEDAKKHGKFFTPPELAEQMAVKFGRIDNVKSTLDPCCGYGNLLLMKMLYDIRVNNLDPTTVFINTYGNDTSPDCLDVCKENFRKFAKHFNIGKKALKFVLESHFSCEDACTSKAYEGKMHALAWIAAHGMPCAIVDGIFYMAA